MNEAEVMIVACLAGGATPSQIAMAFSGLIINVVDGEHGCRAAAMMLEVRKELMLAEPAACAATQYAAAVQARRADMTQKPESSKRAEMTQKPAHSKRAEMTQKPESSKRAGSREDPVPTERAGVAKKPRTSKRAEADKKSGTIERAEMPQKPERWKRAIAH